MTFTPASTTHCITSEGRWLWTVKMLKSTSANTRQLKMNYRFQHFHSPPLLPVTYSPPLLPVTYSLPLLPVAYSLPLLPVTYSPPLVPVTYSLLLLPVCQINGIAHLSIKTTKTITSRSELLVLYFSNFVLYWGQEHISIYEWSSTFRMVNISSMHIHTKKMLFLSENVQGFNDHKEHWSRVLYILS